MALELNKFLTFNIGEEFYGIPVLNVKEIIGMLDITPVHKMPEYIRGIINLRGKIIPVMDLRIRFGIPSREYDARTCIIVIETEVSNQTRLTGMVVDTVSEVLDINNETIELPSSCFGGVNKDYLTGIGKIKDKVIMLLEPINIMSTDEKDVI
ncbi:chemotaxis protein CheW [Clostridium chromiireducens]|uniref:Chemotaxis protein CheW n=1 Tax=Clostridium chromiireducens TaxID=225345 RepID=A0A399INZ7_9CLOT|nr:chemotaxis protein CheW [Clostridium chromiireducens]RII34019.1 chemotaxis protein CheW [Clostridium chromiireducens]